MTVAISAREFIRHALFKTGIYSALKPLRLLKGQSTNHLSAGSIQKTFSAIYQAGVWRHGDDLVPGSGQGSTIAATENLRRELIPLLESLGGKTLLDIGCGDFSWMQYVPVRQAYIGVDVVPAVIERNVKLYSGASRHFILSDATVDPLPRVDIVLCREVLFHLSFADVRRLLMNVLSAEPAYLLLTTDRGTNFNSNIPTGDFRLLNLQAKPFRFPPPIKWIDDSLGSNGRLIGVWRPEEIARSLQL